VIKTELVRPFSVLLLIAACAGSLLAQDNKPALITRKQFAKSNLLFAWQRDIVAGFKTTESCIIIHPSGNFHRESWKEESKAKFAEIGKLSDSELTELKATLDDPGFRAYRQDPHQVPKPTIPLDVGYQIFSVSIFRTSEDQPQNLVFYSNAEYTAEPPEIQRLQQRLHDFETRQDPSIQRVPADGCHAYPVPQKP
jgi:hypothetical protein